MNFNLYNPFLLNISFSLISAKKIQDNNIFEKNTILIWFDDRGVSLIHKTLLFKYHKSYLPWLVSWVINFLMDWFVGWFVGWLVGVSWC